MKPDRLGILIRKAKNLIVEYEGEGQDTGFYTVRRHSDCPDCNGKGIKEVNKKEDSCILCESSGRIEKTDKVIVTTKDKKTIMSCSCTHCSIYSGITPEILCATKIAVILEEAKEKIWNE